jgi:hypothetical protein
MYVSASVAVTLYVSFFCCLRGPPQDAKEPNLLKEISFSTLDVLEDFIDDFKDELTKQDVDLLVPVFNNLASSSPPFTLN